MPNITEIIETPWTVEDAFDFVADFKRIEEWDPSVRACRATSQPESIVGSTYDVDISFAGRVMTMRYEIIEIQRPTRLILHGLTSTSRAIDHVTFNPTAKGATIEWRLRITGRGPMKFLDTVVSPVLKRPLQRLGRQAMDGLARAVQGHRLSA